MNEPLLLLTTAGLRALRTHWVPSPSRPPEFGAADVVPSGFGWDPEPLMDRVRAVLDGNERGPVLDATLAPGLHQALPIPRRLASDPALWRWLGMGPLLGFLHRRWPVEDATDARIGRYLGRIHHHGLGRLWWAAELTVSARGEYMDTRRLVRSQRLLDRVLSSGVGRGRTVLLGLLDALHAENDWAKIDRVTRALGTWSATVCLEALERTEVAEIVRRELAR